ncbi:(2Fe-2S)-binding protein [Dietzia sp. UCD-THP]|uniref:(2Fe-2S)-binding protein n=1 Tax=Dietzia natronolimnaea TaxID=161920 RepID=A0A2A2WND5_9ACTN|nr:MULTISPECIES: Rieske (2Fe-2S) protein [Dietzia]EYT62574.1 (2Fe-2S)-binding protein [Dietzia sp. UCD-THP]PAY22717.1 (2Fe-2S)-binding protein [Dietzia natronolimnaea]
MTEHPAAASVPVGPCTQRRTVLAALPGIILLPGIASACGMTQPAEPASTVQQTTEVQASTMPASDVPVGTAKQVKSGDSTVIVAQPTEGEFVAYSARCTHQGGTVQVVRDLHLRCPLHGAEYDATDGSNTLAPAPRPLDVVPVTEANGQLTIG